MANSNNDYQLSPFNQDPEVLNGFNFAKDILLYDVTLRDGEQTPGVIFDTGDRLRIARALDALGVHRIEAGFPVISEEDRKGVAEIANAGLNAEIWGFGRCLPSDVEVNAACGVRHMVLEISISDLKIGAYGLTREKVLNRILTAMDRALDLGIRVAFMPVDFTRADINFAQKVMVEAVEKGGASEVVIVDTIGVATPEAINYLTRCVREWVDVPVAVHCHNDFGLGLANSLAALKAGAHCVHVSVNCLGERAGNVDLAETVMALKLLYGIDLGINTRLLASVSRMIEEISGYKLSRTKPIVGESIFTRESGGVVQQLVVSPPSVEPFDPTEVGLKRDIVLGKKSGRYSILYILQKLGKSADESQIEKALLEIKKISNEKRRLIEESELLEILEKHKFAD